MKRRRPLVVHPRGFSLLELILAMSVAAMLALTLYAGMRVALQARASAERTIEPTRAVMIAADLIRQDFESVPPPVGVLAGPLVGVHLPGPGGDNDSIEFHTIGRDEPPDDSPLDEGIRKIELYVQTDVNPPVLIRRMTRNLLAATEPLALEEILCRNVRSFSLRYFDGYSWQENWDSTTLDNSLPTAIAMTLTLDDPEAPPTQEGLTGRSVTRVFPLSCAKPLQDAGFGGFQ